MHLSFSVLIDQTVAIHAQRPDSAVTEAVVYLADAAPTGPTTPHVALQFATEADWRRFHTAVESLRPPTEPDAGPHGVVIPDGPR